MTINIDFLKIYSFFLLLLLFSGIELYGQPDPSKNNHIQYVNTFIGTGAHGHTYPGATVPFGMVQLSPDNGTQGWDWCSGYHYSDSVIAGFSHTHLSGTGIGDLLDVSVLPMVNTVPSAKRIVSKFSHREENASPGYYAVMLKDFNIKAELSASERCGFHRYTFPASADAMIRFNLGQEINWDRLVDANLEQINDSTFVGYRFSSGWAPDQKVFFAIRVNKPCKLIKITGEGKRADLKNKVVAACLMFSTYEREQVFMKVGLSSASVEGALEEIKTTLSFDEARLMAENTWEKELGKIEITTKNETMKRIFYTALYHTYLSPVIFSDAQGQYKSVKGNVAQASHPIYTISSLWDVFRAHSPLMTIVQPERISDIINSYLTFYREYGLLPVWDLCFNETNTMTGYHCVPIIADAILKDFKNFNVNEAYEAMKKSAMQNIRGTDVYRQFGYVPQDKKGSSVTITLEYAFDDWCIAQVAKKLGKQDDYEIFMKRSGFWKNLFDKSTGFIRAKNSDGSWVMPFDPNYSEHDENKAMYTEGNAWQHSWFVPQDVYGLISAHGSEAFFIKKLDSLFTVSSQLKGEHVSPDISGLVGQYAHGNEPSHHIAYLYNYAGMPHKTAEKVRYITQYLYTNKPDGLSGNEDCGQMSAWYVFSALGFYPVNPASGRYVLGTPLLDKAEIKLQSGKVFKITAKNLSDQNMYIQKATLNGMPYEFSFIEHKDVIKGGELVLLMGSKPSKTWGTKKEHRP